ncbi:MAG: T9SS type A sorting domain-containing protein [Lentimicrobium sp.]|nr:T9SS type A sorting domain-containing protein [Lentimicrobium sp.]
MILFLITLQVSVFGQGFFNYKKYLFDPPSTLFLYMESIDRNTGYVKINGVDFGNISDPFNWDWGDGISETGWFPMNHTYTGLSQNYTVKVVASYTGGLKDTAEMLVRFIPPSIAPIIISDTVAVYIPDNSTLLDTMTTRLYPPPSTLTFFSDNYFQAIPRSTLEYVLTASAEIQQDLVNDQLFLVYGKFEQYMFRDSTFNGAYSLWSTNPVAFGVGDVLMNINTDYSSLFHEMGHNTTFNTPPDFYYGGNIDGNAYAIYAESLAQIFQHATGYEIINNYDYYGLSEDLMIEIQQEVIRTIKIVREKYDQYLTNGKQFASWNDPSTPENETFLTFMTLAYKFCEHAENSGQGYRLPTKRMMTLLQGFCQDWAIRYDRLHNTGEADTFRSTLMVTALSYAFSSDLKDEFRDLNFPVDDQIYEELYNSVITSVGEPSEIPSDFVLRQNYPNPFRGTTTLTFQLPENVQAVLKVYDFMGRELKTLVDCEMAKGEHQLTFNAKGLKAGVIFYQLQVNGVIQTKKMILLK